MIIIDDTLQNKFGIHFECYKTLYDHTKRNGSLYLKGHCFVGLILKIPVYFTNGGTYYLIVPIGFRLKKDEPENKSKIENAAEMIDWVMEILKDYKMVILLCDNWYSKGAVNCSSTVVVTKKGQRMPMDTSTNDYVYRKPL